MAEIVPDEMELLSRLRLNATDAARVCKVTVRQLTYWTDKGIIKGYGEGSRSYDVSALRKAVSIKRMMLDGYTLEKASQTLAEDGERGTGDNGSEGEGLSDSLAQLASSVETFREKLPAYLAFARLRETLSSLEALDLDCVLDGSTDKAEAARRLAARLEATQAAVDEVVSDFSREEQFNGHRVGSLSEAGVAVM
ncbi:MAG: MerR family transcriptional regulator [Dehalococcoidales bacterium]|nr:MerR family transcriptional regulator [Dehalococcoidales bacterium]